jgi:hypothetical protein
LAQGLPPGRGFYTRRKWSAFLTARDSAYGRWQFQSLPRRRNGEVINAKTEDEFRRIAAVINDPTRPVGGLEVITNRTRRSAR